MYTTLDWIIIVLFLALGTFIGQALVKNKDVKRRAIFGSVGFGITALLSLALYKSKRRPKDAASGLMDIIAGLSRP